jgi:hypothetical protein
VPLAVTDTGVFEKSADRRKFRPQSWRGAHNVRSEAKLS